MFLRQAIVTIWQNYNAIIQNCVNRYISTFLQFILGKICRIHWTKILVHVSQHQKVVRKQVNRNESQFDVWTKSDKTRKLFQRPTLSITVNELASNFFFCFVYMYMAGFRFNRFWIWSVVYIITSLRVQNRIVPGNLSVSVKPFPVYNVLCFLNYCIYDFRTVLRCVDKIPTLIRSQLKQIDCCSFLAPYLNNHTVNHFCKCYFTCHKVDFKIS